VTSWSFQTNHRLGGHGDHCRLRDGCVSAGTDPVGGHVGAAELTIPSFGTEGSDLGCWIGFHDDLALRQDRTALQPSHPGSGVNRHSSVVSAVRKVNQWAEPSPKIVEAAERDMCTTYLPRGWAQARADLQDAQVYWL
jgi:hypothetical protein